MTRQPRQAGAKRWKTCRKTPRKEARCMFSRFLNEDHAFRCGILQKQLLILPFFGLALFLVLTGSSCSTANQAVSAEPKHYIEPPKQKFIPVSTTAFRVCADPNNLPFSNQ